MRIKKFKKYCEAISGTTDTMPIGVVYGRTELPVTMTSRDTEVLYSDLNSEFYTQDDYEQLYQDYLKIGGKPLDGFNKENLEIVLSHLKKAI
jgi:hypothetical protein